MKKAVCWIVACSLVLGLGAFLVFGNDCASYVLTTIGVVRRNVRQSIPLEFELQRARDLSQRIVVDMQRLLDAYVRQQLSTEDLEAAVRGLVGSSAVRQLRCQVVALRDLLEAGNDTVECDGQLLPRRQAEARLVSLFAQYKATKDLLAHRTATLRAKKKALEAMKTRLLSIRAEKGRLDLEVENLAALVQCVKAHEGDPGSVEIAHTSARVREILNDVDERVRVLARKAEIRKEFLPASGSGGSVAAPEQILPAVTAYLQSEGATVGQREAPTAGRPPHERR